MFLPVPLQDYFNGRATSSFTLAGSAYPPEWLPDGKQQIAIAGVPFLIPDWQPGAYNNIELFQQQIPLPEGLRICAVHVIGAAENGHYTERFLFRGKEGSANAWVSLTNWTTEEPQFGETLWRHTPHVVASGGRTLSLNGYLWIQRAELDRPGDYTSLLLQDNPFFHICSITLEGARRS